ncbi:hypothetical protein Ancab_006243 [Ancistrocladus abbreviatus]
MDDRKKLQNKQAPLQGRANFPYLWQTDRHRPPSTGTTATHLELSFLKNVKAFTVMNPKPGELQPHLKGRRGDEGCDKASVIEGCLTGESYLKIRPGNQEKSCK